MPAATKLPSASVMQARARRAAQSSDRIAETEWFIREVCDTVAMTMQKRVKIATELVKSKVVLNISRPVTKTLVGGKVRVTNRSKPGEFPKADTALLMKTIFGEVQETLPDVWDGYIGTPLDYGVRLELKMQRSFLVRTFEEERPKIMRILNGPIA